jgi:hypothetical protein
MRLLAIAVAGKAAVITGCGEKAAPVSDTLLGEIAWVLGTDKLNEMVFN